MPLDRGLLDLFRTRDFWAAHYFLTEPVRDYPEVEALPIRFRLPGRFALLLRLSSLLHPTLYLVHPSLGEPAQLGWDDEAHWHPDVLRWEECAAVCRCVAAGDPALPHPGWPLLLLYRFTPITPDDDRRAIRSLLRTTWRATGLFGRAEVERLIDRADHATDGGYEWFYTRRCGWTLEGGEEYTLRTINNPDFPFRLWGKLRDRLRRCVPGAALEGPDVLGQARGRGEL